MDIITGGRGHVQANSHFFAELSTFSRHEYTFLKSAYGLTGELLFVSINML